ncbi:MAG: S1 RNA-binding domain-containing protein, partial [Phycisphaerales bacterium JB040]
MSNEQQPNQARPHQESHKAPDVPPREPISVTPDRISREDRPIARAGNDDKLPTPTTSPDEPAASMSPPDPMVTEPGMDTSNGGSAASGARPDAATPSRTPVPTPPPVPTGEDQPGRPATVREVAEKAGPETPAKLDDRTLAEIDAAMAELDAESGVGAPGQPRKAAVRGPRKVEGGREHRTGTVVSVGATDIFVEFGPKELGVVEASQYADALPKVGDAIEVVVQKYEASESIYICVRPGTVQKADWEMLEPGQTVEAKVVGVNKGGLECEVAGHGAFMPASQVDIDHVQDLSVFVGEKLPCLVQRVDRRGRGNIVLSRREIIARDRAKLAETLRETLKEGDTVEGTVRKIMDFGAFVEVAPGVEGLVHISEIDWRRIGSVSDVLKQDEIVSAKVLSIDPESR